MEAEIIYIGLAAVFGIFMAWGIGANDVANAIGPLAAVISVAQTGVVGAKAALPVWVAQVL